MRKILSLCMAVLMLCTLCTTAFAATINEGDEQQVNTTVLYGTESGYTVSIPESVSIHTDTHKGTATISVTDALLAYDEILNVTMTGFDVLVDAADNANTLSYKIGTTEGADDVTNNTVVLSVAAGDIDGSEQVLYFELTQDVTTAGAYSDVLTFAVSLESSANIEPGNPTVSGVWVFNKESPTQFFPSKSLTFNVNFTSNNKQFTAIKGSIFSMSYIGTENVTVIDNYDEWSDDAYKTIDFGATEQAVSYDFYALLTSSATQKSGGEDGEETVSLISFIIGGTTYQAVDGMTWAQWVESEYNTGDWYISGDDVRDSGLLVSATPTSVIESDRSYKTAPIAPGPK